MAGAARSTRRRLAVAITASLVIATDSFRSPLAPARGARLRLGLATTSTSAGPMPAELREALDRGDPEAALVEVRDVKTLDAESAARLLDVCAGASTKDAVVPYDPEALPAGDSQRFVSAKQELRLQRCYEELRRLGLAKNYGVEVEEPLPVPDGWAMGQESLESQTGLPLAAFRPNPTTGRLYWLGGALLSALEVAVAYKLDINPQPLFLATLAFAATDQVALGGAVSETILSTLQPDLRKRIVYHEAGHLLLAYLLGCPVQSITLSAREALARAAIGKVAPGTAFFDVELNRAAQSGVVARGTINRYSIIVMGGIASEAMVFGAAEGGRDDENALIQFLQLNLQSSSGGFSMDRVAEQARWSAVNAIKLLQKHRDLYDRLVAILEDDRGDSIGRCILAMEGAIGK